MKLKNIFLRVLLLTLGTSVMTVSAETQVVGKLDASGKVFLNSGSSKQSVSNTRVPYILGDLVSTKGVTVSSGKQSSLTFDNANIVVGHDTSLRVLSVAPLRIELLDGGVRVEVKDAAAVEFINGEDSLQVSSLAAGSVVAAVDGVDLVVASQSLGVFTLQEPNGVVSQLMPGKAYTAGAQPRVIDVQVPADTENNVGRKLLLTLLGGAGAYVFKREVIDDDPDGSPTW